ncbi:hypothetical protein [Pseudoalteromonas sp. A757]|uniref:hypothetical protein n=1 Tax=Pseudoalteromonas sp. A757 TaxID=2250709 RepID=UPI000FFE5315|nr:hypothetical protein [Pseudoalteromonas sp. A757]RXE86207.1 hypothetical protein DRB05_12345 [Pseudoalteromonas sp. A757]
MTNQLIIASAITAMGFLSLNVEASNAIPEQVIEAYQAGLQGSQEQNQLAFNALKEINEKAPNPVALAMLGSTETTQARYTNKPWQKMQYAEKGIAKLSRAIKQAKSLPYSLRARVNVTAGCTFAQVPKMMNRAEHGSYLLNKVISESEQFKQLEPALQVSAYRCAAAAAEKLDDAEQAKSMVELAQKLQLVSTK